MRQKILTLISNLRSHEGFLRYAKNTSWLMGEKVLRMFMGLFVGIWVARYLGPEQFGLLSYAQSFVFLFTAVASLGLDSIVVRELVRDSSQRDILLGTAFGLKLIGAVAVVPILWVAVQFTNNDSFTNFLIFITAGATIFQSFNVIDFYYQSTVMSKYVALTNTICLFLSSLIKVALIMNHASLVAFAWMGVFDAVVVMLGLVYFYVTKTRHKLVAWRFKGKIALKLTKDSLPMLVGSLSFIIFSNLDVVMLKHFSDELQVGYYSAAYKLATLWYFIPGLILSSIFPSLISQKENNLNQYNKNIILVTSMLVYGALGLAFVISFLAKTIVALTYGKQYDASIPSLIMLIWINIIIFFNSAWNYWLIIEDKKNYILLFHFMVAVTNIVFNFALIPLYGAIGAAYAIMLSLLATMGMFVIFDKQTRNLLKSVLMLEAIKYVKKDCT